MVAVLVAVSAALTVAATLMTDALPVEQRPPWVAAFTLLFTMSAAAALVAHLRGRDVLALFFFGLGPMVGNALILAHEPFSNPLFGNDAQTVALLALPIGPILMAAAAIAKLILGGQPRHERRNGA